MTWAVALWAGYGSVFRSTHFAEKKDKNRQNQTGLQDKGGFGLAAKAEQ